MRKKISKKKLKEFSYLIGIGFPLLIGWFIPFITGHQFRIWTLYISIPSLLMGYFFPYQLSIFYKFWMNLGHVLGWINSRIILGIIFIFVLLPIAIVMKLFGYDPLKISNKELSSYKEKKTSKVDLTRIF